MKRFFTRWLFMTAFLIVGLTTAVAQQSVLDEDFANGTLPKGWAKAGNYWDFSEFNAKFFAPFENAKDTLYAPVVSLGALENEPTVTFSYSLGAAGSNVNILTLLYRAGGQGAWIALDTFDVATDGKTAFVQPLPKNLTSIQLAIAADYEAGGSTYVYQLRVANKKEATAAPANFKAENLQANGVKLSWEASESDYWEKNNLKLSTSPLSDPDVEMGDVKNFMGETGLTDEWCELSDLEPNTKYYAYVQYDCGYGDVSPWAELNFTTPCVAMQAPLYEDFENGLSGCFSVFKQGSATTAEVSGEYPYNSMYSFKVNIEGTSGFHNYLVLPELEGDVKKYQISFMAASAESGNTYSRRVAVGVCSDANDIANSFTEVTTLDLPKARTWEDIVVSLKGYTGEGKYIALKIGHDSKKTNLFIDNIRVEKASECPKPMFVQVSNVSTNAATVSWTKTGNENEWNLVVSTKPLANPEDIEPKESKGEFAGSVSTNPYTLSKLQPNTTYYAYVQAACGSSEWTEAIEFKTQREITYPYSEHFDRLDPELYTNNTAAIPSGWVFDDRGNNPDYTSYYDKQYTSDSYRPYVTTAQNNEATAYVKASLLLRGTSGTTATSTNYTSIAMLPAMPKPVNTMMVTFWAYSSAAQTVKIGVANTQTNDLAQGQQLGANITEVGEAAITGGSVWKQYKVLLTNYTGDGRYITFYLKPGTATPSVYIDDIEIDEAPDCNAVSTLDAEATGIDKATATWTDASSSASWTIKVSSTEIDPSAANGDIVAAQTVKTKTYNISGLAMGQTYYIYVSPSCGDAWVSTTVTTLVGLQVPYYNDFTDENTGANATRGPKNWTLGFTYTDAPGATSTYWPHVNTTAWTNAPADVVKNSVYFNNSTSASGQFPYAIMPELLNGNVKDMKIGFYAYWNNAKPSNPANYACVNDSYYGVLKIGVVSSPTDINKTNKFTKVTEVAAVRCKEPKAAEYFVVDMSKYTGSGKYIVFYQDTAKSNYMMIDNLYVGPKSEPVPAVAIADLKYTELTTTGATLAWKEQGEATKWNVRVFTEKQDDPDAGTPVFSTAVDNTPAATITGLKHSTQYYAYVQSSQSSGNGAWISTMFWTDCEKAPLPFTADFNSFEHGSTSLNTLSWCYMVGDKGGSQLDATYTGTTPYTCNYVKNGQATTSTSSATGPGTTYYYIDHTYGNDPTTNTFYMYAAKDKLALLVLPELDGDLANMTMRFYGCYSSAFSASSSTGGGAIEVAIMNEDGSFTHVENFKLSKAKDWEEFNVLFPENIHSGRIAFRINNTAEWRSSIGSTYSSGSSFYMYLDDIYVQQIPQCQKVLDIEVADVDSASAKISWDASEASAWNLKVSTVELADPDAATADIFDGAVETTPSKLISGMPDNSKIYVYVQTVRPEKSCVGEWSNVKIFKTLCKLTNFPYTESFDPEYYTTTGAGNIPDCSTLSGEDADHSYITTRGTGNLALYLKQVTKDHNNYFAFPALNVDSVKRLQLNMKVNPGSTTTTNYYYYEVGVMTDPNDPSTFVSVAYDSVQGAAATVFYDKAYTFEKYAGDEHGKFGTYIALKPLQYQNPITVQSDPSKYYAGTIYVDDITIDFIETCFKPTDVTAKEIGIDTVALTWNSNNEGASYLVRVFADKDADPKTDAPVAETTVTDKEAVIRGLTGNSTYYAYVQALCSASDKSKWSTVYQFKTECPLVTALPYADDFEAYDSNTVPDCWEPLDNGTNAKSRVGTTYKFSGTKSLTVNYGSVGSSSGNTYYQSQIVTPALDVENLKDVLVYFNMRSGSAGGSLKIEAVADETSQAEAITLTQINDIPADWTVAYLDLAKYYTSVQPYKRLRFTPTAQGKSIYIDDIVFTTDKSVVLPVQDLKLSMVTETTAKFSFVEYTPTITEWQVAYVAAGGDIADAKIQTIDATEYTITGLAPNTSYDIYVRGNVEGDQWVGPLTATTIQTPAPLPLISGFEDDVDQWVFYQTQKEEHFYPNFWIVGGADKCAGTGNNALFITNDSINYIAFDKNDGTNMDPVKYAYQGSNIVATSYVWATRNINIEGVGTYKFSFKYKVPKCYSSDGLYVKLIPAGATFKAGTATLLNGTTCAGDKNPTASSPMPDNCYAVMGKQNAVTDWTWYNTSLDIVEPGIYTLCFYWYNPSAGEPYATPAAIDSVIVEEYLCTTPKDIEFTTRTATEVSLQWFGGKCKDFEYVVSKFANLGMPNLIDEEDKVAYGTLNNGPQVTVKDLIPNSAYSFYVRTICPDGYTDWVEYDFETPCALEELPYTESFTETPECWILTNASVGTTQVGTSAEHEKWNRLQLSNGGMAILPELAVDPKNVEIEIGLFNITTNLGAVQLGVMDNTWDVSTFQEIAYIQTVNKPGSTGTYTPSTLETFSKMMNLYQGTGKVLAIKNATTYSIGIKYVKLTELPDCVKPQQVEITYPTENSATVNWLAGLEEAWEIMLNDSIIENVTTNPYKITGLEQGTTYKVAVRALCDENTKSEWSLPTTFQTPCGVNPLPMNEDFSALPNPPGSSNLARATLTCWDNLVSTNKIEQVFNGSEKPFQAPSNIYAGQTWVQNWISMLGDYAQLHSYHGVYNPTYRYKWFISPQYAIEGNATLSFNVRRCGNKGQKVEFDDGRFFVAISTDNGATWKKENATQITDIDTVYSTKSISLDQYAGKAIRVAFYDENNAGSYDPANFLLIDNVRMNCSEIVPLADNACQGYDYENYGFSIKKEDLPLAGKDSTYTRLAVNSNGCDTVYSLTLITRPKPQSQTIYATICQGEGYPFGDWYLTEPNPENQPYYITDKNEYGCDVYTYLYLTVNPSDTTIMAPVEITNDLLPYYVDEFYTIPANQPVGKDTVIVKRGESCSFNKYFITIDRCQRSTLLSDTICEDVKAYSKYNFVIEQDSLPAMNAHKRYEDTIRTKQGCDSVVSLILFVFPNDTITIDTAVYNNELLYADVPVDNYFSIEKGTEVGKYDTLLSVGNCGYRYYRYEVKQCTMEEAYADTICATDMSYVGFGFNIEADQLPAPGRSKQYSHVDRTADQCDSTTNLYLYVAPAVTNIIPVTVLNSELPYKVDSFCTIPAGIPVGPYDTVVSIGFCLYNQYQVTIQQCEIPVKYSAQICESAESYEGFGFNIAKDQLPAPGAKLDYVRHEMDKFGCDSIISLSLFVNPNDTDLVPVSIFNTDLPYVVDPYFTVPADAAIATPFEVVLNTEGCSYNKYQVMVTRCTTQAKYADDICEDQTSYVGFGFNLAADQLPAPGTSKEYTHVDRTALDCDSTTILTLTAIPAVTNIIPVTVLNSELPYKVDSFCTIPAGIPVGPYDTVVSIGFCSYNQYQVTIQQCEIPVKYSAQICESAESYEGFGFNIAKDQLPAPGAKLDYVRHEMDKFGCDSIISLSLFVNPNDTDLVPVSIFNNDLPYVVDPYYTVPADAAIATPFEVVLNTEGCSYNKYQVMVTRCTTQAKYADDICEDQTSYVGFGFNLAADQLPAPGTSKEYMHVDRTALDCDSTTILTLFVLKADTMDVKVEILNTDLPYQVDGFYTVPAETAVGADFYQVVKVDGCAYNRYHVTVAQCETPVKYAQTICEDAEQFEGFGFSIEKSDLPAPLTSKDYIRHAMDPLGCDSVITLTLTAHNDTTDIHVTKLVSDLPYQVDEFYTIPADALVGQEFAVVKPNGNTACSYNQYIVMISDCGSQEFESETLCEDQTSYQGYGFVIAPADMPAAGKSKSYHRTEPDGLTCKNITLVLTVTKNDTTDVPVSILNNDLPYMVDEYYTIPAGTAIGTFSEVIKIGDNGCSYNRYNVTIGQCTASSAFSDVVCADQVSYDAHGFEISADDMPAPGAIKSYSRHETTIEGCDSVITLSLRVLRNDTTDIPVSILNNDLPYMVDEYYTIPAGTAIGTFSKVVKIGDNGCSYNRYNVTIGQCTASSAFSDAVCADQVSYDAHGFDIVADEMPAPGTSKKYTRHETTDQNCDSVITLTLFVNENDTLNKAVTIFNNDLPYMVDEYYTIPAGTAIGTFSEVVKIGDAGCSYIRYNVTIGQCTASSAFSDVVCADQVSYDAHGFEISADDMPAPGAIKSYTRHETTVEGCDCVITLSLRVLRNDTTDIPVSILNNDLPYMIDEYYTIPAGTAIGTFSEVVKIGDNGCSYNRYNVTIGQCTASSAFSDAVCADQVSYDAHGFDIVADEMPAPGTSKKYTRHETTDQNCDSVITLTLFVNENDTLNKAVTIFNNDLPYVVDSFYTIPAGTPIGSFSQVVKLGDAGCSYIRYNVTINQKTAAYSFADAICEDESSYEGYGFVIPSDIYPAMPAAGERLEYVRHALDEAGVDSVITFTLTKTKADTLVKTIAITNDSLPYFVDEFYTISEHSPVDSAFSYVVKVADCAYNKYEVFVARCVEEFFYADSICESAEAYALNGFAIPADELPAAGESKSYTRKGVHITSVCDSLITLNLYVMKNDTTSFDDAVCETQSAYQGHGFMLTSADFPAVGSDSVFYRIEQNAKGCDSIIALMLSVVPNDTTVKTIEIDNTRLPYVVDPYYTVPEDAVIGQTFETVVRLSDDECSYRKYIVTVTQCSRSFSYAETLCEGQQIFEGYGFAIAEADMPAIGSSKDYYRSNMSEQGCDSLITLTLIMNAADTTSITVNIDNTQLPYYVDQYYTVPEGAVIGEPFETVVRLSDAGCSYNRYLVTISAVECSEEFNYADSICALVESYEGFGFLIAADQLPAAGESVDYTRSAKDAKGCDSLITLTLKVYNPDTLYVVDTILVNALPYIASGETIVPAGAPVGDQPAVTFTTGDCAYITYLITVLACETPIDLTDDVCVGSAYNEFGFSIPADSMPAVGLSKEFVRTNKSETGCDSIITLTLTVKGDTIYLDPLEINEDQLPYRVNEYITIPEGTPVGVYEEVIQIPGDCQFIAYSLTIHERGFGIINVTDAVDYIEVYDILGHKITTIRHDEEAKSLPTGVYMLRTIMKSGQIVNSKAALK